MRKVLAGAVPAGVIPARYCHCVKRSCCRVQIRSVPWPQFSPSHVLLLSAALAEKFADRLLHPNNRTGFGRQYLFNGSSGDIFPDFLLDIDPEFDDVMTASQVFDAKYRTKALDGDVYKQMLSYMYRFDSKIGKLMYPVSSDSSEKGVKVLKLRRDNSIILKAVPFEVPAYKESADFESFAKEMKNAENNFLSKLLDDK